MEQVTLVKAKDALAQLQNKHMNDLGRIDYVALSKDEGYTGFQEAVCEFQKISISAMTLSQRKAFFINLCTLSLPAGHQFPPQSRACACRDRAQSCVSYSYSVGRREWPGK